MYAASTRQAAFHPHLGLHCRRRQTGSQASTEPGDLQDRIPECHRNSVSPVEVTVSPRRGNPAARPRVRELPGAFLSETLDV